MSTGDLDALDKLRASATRGWNRLGGTHDRTVINEVGEHVCDTARETDAALIVAAVNALEPLIAEARKYRALREAVEGLATRLERESATVAELAGLPPDDFLHFWRDDAPTRLRTAVATVDGGAALDPT